VGLAQAELERRGIVTASITMLPEITARIGVPRALEVPFPLGYPLGLPNDPAMQLAILRALLELVESDVVPVVGRFAASAS
jgi:hypothetical protein